MPVCPYDARLARDLSEWIRELGGVKNYPALLVWSADLLVEDRDYIRNNFRETFMSVREMEPHLGPEYVGWPAAPNRTFEACVLYCCSANPRYANGGPWLFLEADQVPTRSTWMDEICKEYNYYGKACMGHIEQSWVVPVAGQKQAAGHHLVGTAVYPGNFDHLTERYKGLLSPAFDVAMQDDIVGRGLAANSPLFAHCWLTDNYVITDDGKLAGQKREGRLFGQIGFSLDRVVDPKEAALIHGCKDTSLLKCARELWLREHAPKKRKVQMRRKRVTSE